MYPRNGIEFLFNADWCGGATQSHNALRQIVVFNNYQPTNLRLPVLAVLHDPGRHGQPLPLQISSNHIDVWASDAGGANFRKVVGTDVATLPLTRGYLSFQHAQYAADKFNSTDTMTYHWHALGFDGPVLPTDRGYEVLDARAEAGQRQHQPRLPDPDRRRSRCQTST